MGAIGHQGAGFLTETPLQQNYIGEVLKTVDDNVFKIREEKRKEQDKANALKKDNEVKDDFDAKVELTGNQSINDLTVPFSISSASAKADNVRKINLTTNPIERQQLIQANNKIKQNFDTYKQIPSIINAKMAEITKGVEEGKLNPRDAERAAHLFDGLNNGKAKVYIDPYGVARITTYKVDENGQLETGADGKPIILEKDQDVAAIMKSFQVHAKSDFDTHLLNSTEKFKLDKKVWETGGNKFTQEIKDQRTNDAANAFAQGEVSQPNERFELSQRTGIPESDTKALEAQVAKQFINRIPQENMQDHSDAYDSNKLAKQKQAHDFKKEAEKEKQTISDAGVVTKNGFVGGEFDDKGNNKGGLEVPKGSKYVSFSGVNRPLPNKQTENLKSVYKNPNGNGYIFVVEQSQGETKKVLTDEAKQKLADDENYLPTNEDYETISTKPAKEVAYDSHKQGSDVLGLITQIKTKKGNYIKNMTQFDTFMKNKGLDSTSETKTTTQGSSSSSSNTFVSKKGIKFQVH
jgi:hypothetical protein